MRIQKRMSASNIRYLIALNALDHGYGTRCIDIAKELDVTKPSVHSEMVILCDRSLVEKKRYGMVFLTQEGRELAAWYAERYDVIYHFFYRKFALSIEDARDVAVVLLANTSREGLEGMCETMQNRVAIWKSTYHPSAFWPASSILRLTPSSPCCMFAVSDGCPYRLRSSRTSDRG